MMLKKALFEKAVRSQLGDKHADLALLSGSVAALLTGNKVASLAMFARGFSGLERAWRAAHPDFDGGFAERWQAAIEFYDKTHAEPTNKKLHIIGIPMIVGGTAGLLIFPVFRPLWGLSALSFTVGWVLNFIGHGVYEKAAPAFADDPLSFIAGPVWDLQQIRKARSEGQSVEIVDIDVPAGAAIN